MCLVGAKHNAFFSGHNSVDHNIFFQRVSGFATWLLAFPRHDLMLALLRSGFLLAILPKRPKSVKKLLKPGQVLPFQHKISSALSVLEPDHGHLSDKCPFCLVAQAGIGWPDCSAVWMCYFLGGLYLGYTVIL